MGLSPNLCARAAAAAAALAIGSFGAEALAVECSTLPQPFYGIGGSGPNPIFAKLGAALAGLSTPQTFVYQSGGGCTGVAAFQSASPSITGNATYWTTVGGVVTANTCTITTPVTPDFAVSNNEAINCPGNTALPAGVGDFLGPVQSIDFIVPSNSGATAISAEAGYFLYGFPGNPDYPVGNWTTPADVITRNDQSSQAILLGIALNVPLGNITSTKFKVDASTSAVLADVVNAGSTSPKATIGYVTTDAVLSAPAGITVLAYQHYGQQCGWTPSSTPTGLDQINVRNGHYALWANLHFIAAVNGSNVITDQAAANFIGWFQGTVTPPTGIDVDAISIKEGAVIDCAMEVKRDHDIGPLYSYAPAAPCDCYFENVATGSTPASCTACTTSSTCPASAPVCTRGFCEAN